MPTTEEILAEYYSDPRRALKAPAPEVDPYWVPPAPPTSRGEIKNLPARPADPFAAPLAEQLSPTMGGYGMGQLLAETYGDVKDRDWNSVLANSPYLLSIFAGPRARTGNKAMLGKAQEMHATGAPRDAIWKDTGWFQGRDGQWRFEIDDSAMKHVVPPVDWIPRKEDGQPRMAPNLETAYTRAEDNLAPMAPVRVKRLFEHNDLADAYPHGFTRTNEHADILGMPIQLIEGGDTSGALIGKLPDARIGLHETLPPGSAKSTLLHELQHAVQDREGFARGDNPANYRPDSLRERAIQPLDAKIQALMEADAEAARAYRARNVQQARLRDKEWTQADQQKADQLDAILNGTPTGRELDRLDWERSSIHALPEKHWQDKVFDTYRKAAGEVESRNVQTRMGMTADERRARPPWETEDVPSAEQILRQNYGGSQMSMRDNEGLSYLLRPKSKVDVIGEEVGALRPNGVSQLKVKNAPDGYESSRFVYSKDGQIIGAMQVTKTPSGKPMVANTYVAPEYRRHGVASELNQAAEDLYGRLDRSEGPSESGTAFRRSLGRE